MYSYRKSNKKKSSNRKIINIKKIKRKNRTKSKELRKIFKKIEVLKQKKIIWLIIWAILLIIWINILIQKTVYKAENLINEISFTKKNMEEYDNPYLYRDIQEELEWKNYYHYKLFKLKDFEEQLKEKYFVIKELKIQKTKNLKYLIDISFIKPDIILQDWVRNIWMIDWNFFDIYEWNNIWSWVNSILIPEYTQSLKTLDWFFNKINKEEFLLQINTINIFFEWNINSIKYLPGWSKTLVNTLDGKKIYFNNIKPLSEQLEKLYIYQSDKNLYEKYKEIDLGSLDEVIVK